MSKSKKVIAALGVAAVLGGSIIPLSSYAADPASDATDATTVTVTIADAIEISLTDLSTSGGISMKANEFVDSSTDANKILHKLSVTTNTINGYKITVKDSDTTTALTNSKGATIPTASGALAKGTAGWGFQVNTDEKPGSVTNAWIAMPASDASTPATILDRAAKATDTAQYTEHTYVRYGVATAENQASGAYTDAVIYTATVGTPAA